MRRLILLFLFCAFGLSAQSFTEFYLDAAAGSNLNGGAPIGGVYPLTYTSGTWVQATGVFTVASGDPAANGVTVGDFASVYPDGTTPDSVFVGRVTARDTTTITVSLTVKIGAAPTNGTNTRTIKVGGAWRGPSGASEWPVNQAIADLKDVAGNIPRYNFKSGTTYSSTVQVNPIDDGPIVMRGYTTTVGDGGKAVFSSTINSAAAYLWNVSDWVVADASFVGGATSGSYPVVSVTDSVGGGNVFYRVSFSNGRGSGLLTATTIFTGVELEAYGNNTTNTASLGGFHGQTGYFSCQRCISHDNPGSNTSGFIVAGGKTRFDQCISDTNGGDGFSLGGNTVLTRADANGNGGDGLDLTIPSPAGASVHVENSNFIKNGGWGINAAGVSARLGLLLNNGFGAGTQANTSGTITAGSLLVAGSVTYADDVTPWTDPDNGDFRISLAAAKSAGIGAFLQLAPSYAGTVAYSDIGAAQSVGAAATAHGSAFVN
jgi:hypothetical protein